MQKLSRLWPLPAVAAAAAIAVLALTGGSSTPQSATGSVHPAGWGATPPGFVAPRALTAVPTATMYDAVTLGNIPHGPFAVAGYVAGAWKTWFSLAGDFPSAHRVSIAIHLGQHAMCGDFELGDMDPSTAGTWARQDAGFPIPCEYGDLSNMPAIEASDRAALGPNWRAHVLLWLAWYRGFPGLVAGFDAVQFSDTCLGLNLDCNTVSLNFLRIAQPPYVAPKPKPPLPVCIHRREAASTCSAAKAKIASRQRAATSSMRALAARGCVVLEQRIQWFGLRLKSQPHTKVAYRKGALIASRRAYQQRSCGVFAQRTSWFTAAAAKLEAAN